MNESYNTNKFVSKKTFIASIIMLCAFFVLCMLTFVYAINKTDIKSTGSYIPASAEISIYVIRNIDGKVCVCDYSDGSVIQKLDVYVSTLPVAEQEALENGVYLYSLAELVSAIEAYTS